MSFDNTGQLGASTWRHVAFVERPEPLPGLGSPRDGAQLDGGAFSWLMMSDVCKHCERAGCLEACPTGSILRTEFGSVYVQPDVCNGCGYCVSASPFGVSAADQPGTEGLHAFFLLCDVPEKYNLPSDPVVPTKKIGESWRAMAWGIAGLAALAIGSVLSARSAP